METRRVISSGNNNGSLALMLARGLNQQSCPTPQNRDLCRSVAAKAQDCDRADWRFLIEHIFLNKITL